MVKVGAPTEPKTGNLFSDNIDALRVGYSSKKPLSLEDVKQAGQSFADEILARLPKPIPSREGGFWTPQTVGDLHRWEQQRALTIREIIDEGRLRATRSTTRAGISP